VINSKVDLLKLIFFSLFNKEKMEKLILVYLDKVPVLNVAASKNTTIKEIKKILQDKYPKYNIRMYINSVNELKVFDTDKYDDMNLETVFDKMENPVILLEKRKHGKIRIGQQQRAKAYPSFEKYEIIPAWSRGAGEWKNLSPFYVKFPDGIIFENFWQSQKVWKKVEKQNTKNWKWPEEIHVDKDDNPNEKWFIWHESLLHHDLPVRRPNGRNIPLYAYWDGEKLDTVESRKQIYIPYLKELYRSNPTYLKLLEKVKSGKDIILVEPDGPLLEAYPDGLEVDLPLLYNLIDRMNYKEEGYANRYRPYGHGYVLAMTLLEDLEK